MGRHAIQQAPVLAIIADCNGFSHDVAVIVDILRDVNRTALASGVA